MHPIAFKLGPLSVHWYGILVAAGFLIGFWTAARRAPREGISGDAIMDSAPWLLIGAVIGARLLHVISYWKEEFAGKSPLEMLMIQKGGLVFYGGFIGACLATIIYARVRKLPLWKVADIFSPSIALGHAFGRVGCLMTGCCFGKPCALPWAIRFPPDHQTLGEPVHPVQIYEALLNLGLYALLAALFRRKKFDGQVFAIYLVLYALLRSFVELFRADYKPGEFLNGFLTPGQNVSIAILIAGIGLLLFLRKPRPIAT